MPHFSLFLHHIGYSPSLSYILGHFIFREDFDPGESWTCNPASTFLCWNYRYAPWCLTPASLCKLRFSLQEASLSWPALFLPCPRSSTNCPGPWRTPAIRAQGMTHLHLEASVLGTIPDVAGGDEVHAWDKEARSTEQWKEQPPPPMTRGCILGPSLSGDSAEI